SLAVRRELRNVPSSLRPMSRRDSDYHRPDAKQGPPPMTRTRHTFAEPASTRSLELHSPTEPMARWRDVFRHAQALDVETWHETLRSTWGRYKPTASDPKACVAKIHAQSVYGF